MLARTCTKTVSVLSVLVLALLVAFPAQGNASTRKAKKEASKKRSLIVGLGRQSGTPEIRARATAICIRFDRKMRKKCAAEGAADPAYQVQLATAHALYLTRQNKAADRILTALFQNPRVPYKGMLERVFDLPAKQKKVAQKKLLSLLANTTMKLRDDRVREMGADSGDFSRSVLVSAALGKKEPLRSDFIAWVPRLRTDLDMPALERLYTKGNEELKTMVLDLYEKLPANTQLPKFILKQKRGRKTSLALSEKLGFLLAKHRAATALDHLLPVLKAAKTDEEQIKIILALSDVVTKRQISTLNAYTDKGTNRPLVRWAAWAILMRAGDGKALGKVDRWVQSDKPFKREMGTRALAKKDGTKAIPRLVQLLSDGQGPVRIAAAQVLGEIGDASALDPLLESVNTQQDKAERRIIASALFKICPNARLTELSYLLQDQDKEIRSIALSAFVHAKDAQLIPVLSSLKHHPDQTIRRLAMEAIILADPNEGISAFSQGLPSFDGSVLVSWTKKHGAKMSAYVKKALTSPRAELRSYAVDSLQYLPKSDRVDVALTWVKKTTNPSVRVQLMEILVQNNAGRAVSVLEEFAVSKDLTTRSAAIRLLAKIRKSTDLVTRGLEDPEISVQLEALAGLLGN